MSTLLTLVTHAPTAATNRAAFADGEPLDDRGLTWANEARGHFVRATRGVRSPAPACRQTAEALDLVTEPDPGLRDWNLGRWRGRTLEQVAAAEPEAVSAWLTDPDATPHGGESLTALLARVGGWLAAVPADGHTVAVTHAAVVRAAVVSTLTAGAAGFWRLDAGPLTATVLRGRPGRWTVRATGTEIRDPRHRAGADGS